MASLASVGILFFLWMIASTSASPIAVADDVNHVAEVNPLIAVVNRLLRAQSEIVQINAEALKDVSMHLLNARLTALEQQIKELKQQSSLDDGGNFHVHSMKKLESQYTSLADKLNDVQAMVETTAHQQDVKDIVDDIRNNRTRLAEEKLRNRTDITDIVHEAYAATEDNFKPLLRLAELLPNITAKYDVVKRLYVEMLLNRHSDPYKLIDLARVVELEVKNRNGDPEVEKMSTQLADDIRGAASQLVIKSLSSSERRADEKVRELTAALSAYNAALSDEVTKRSVHTLYGEVETEKILSYLFDLTTTRQAAAGMKVLISKLNNDGGFHDNSTIKIASFLHRLRIRSDYADLTPSLKYAVQDLVDFLPDCVWNLFSEPTVCLWNVGRSAYLEAVNDSDTYDKDRRKIVVSLKNTANLIPEGAPWIVHERNKKFLFSSKRYADEYLYAAEINPPDTKKLHFVFSWIPGRNTDKQSLFTVEAKDDACLLKSYHFKEYLYVPVENQTANVFTWNDSLPVEKLDSFLWAIKKC